MLYLVEKMWGQFCKLWGYEANMVETANDSIQGTVPAVQEKIVSGMAVLS